MISVGSPLRSDGEQGHGRSQSCRTLAGGTSKIGERSKVAMPNGWVAVLLLAAAFMLRLGYLATPGLDSDGAIFGLMAIHILRGELPIFQWGLQYMGTIESFVAAPLMLVFGPTRFALDLSPVIFNMLFLYAVYLYAREAAGRRIGLWALAFASFPPCFLVSNVVVARGGYSETLALGTLAAWFALRAAGAEDLTTERRALVATGITLGLSFWTHLNTVIYGTAIVAFWAIERPKLLGKRAFRTGAWFLVGSLPFWIGTVRSHFGTFAFGSPPCRRSGSASGASSPTGCRSLSAFVSTIRCVRLSPESRGCCSSSKSRHSPRSWPFPGARPNPRSGAPRGFFS